MMHMFFWCGTTIKDFLFSGFNISSIPVLLGTCAVLLSLGVFMEYMVLLQAKARQADLIERQRQLRTICPSESDTLINQGASTSTHNPRPPPKKRNNVARFFCDLGIWLTQQCIGYLLMLSVMIYNVYFVIAIVLGYAIGYFIFGQTAIKIKLKNCQVKRETFCMRDCSEPDKRALIQPGISTESERADDTPICHTRAASTDCAA